MTPLLVLRRHYVLLTFLRWFPTGLVIPVQVLLLSGRGLSLPEVGAVFAVYSVTCALLELPTGSLADVVGRRTVLVLSIVLGVAANLVLALAPVAPALAVGTLLGGAARALDSGPLQAWYVDAVHSLDRDADLGPGLARGASADALGLALGALAGGALTLVPLPDSGGAPVLSLSVPFLAAVAFAGVQLVLTLRWVHDPPAPRARGLRAVVAGVPATVRAGAALAARNAVLRRLTVRATLLGVVLAGTEKLAPLQFGERAGAVGYSAVVTAGFAGSALGARLAPALARLVGGTGRGIVAASLLAAVAAACLALPGWWAAAGAYVCLYAALGLDDPLSGELLHAETAAAQRSTLLSVQSLVLQAGGAAGTLAVPALVAATSFGWGWAALAAVTALAGLAAVGLPSGRTAPEPVVAPPVTLG